MITITETLYKKMPDDIKACFRQLPNPSSEEVRECFPETKSGGGNKATKNAETFLGTGFGGTDNSLWESDSGNASRFFKSIIYQAKASKNERNKGCEDLPQKEKRYMATANGTGETSKGMDRFTIEPVSNNHPTVKPIALMEYLIKMVTPKGGIILDPFAGSGSTLVAAKQNGFNYIGIELTEDYIPIIEARLNGMPNTLF